MTYFKHESSYLDEDVVIGDGTKIWHFCHISRGAVIGANCNIGQNVYIGYNVKIGNNCKIQNNVSVYDGVQLEDGVFCGPSCVFTNDLTPRAEYPKGLSKHIKTLVKHGATIGANATVVCGHTIGEYAMIGAGSLVTKDVPPYSLVYGVPATVKGYVCSCGEKLNDEGVCKMCGKNYELEICVYGGFVNNCPIFVFLFFCTYIFQLFLFFDKYSKNNLHEVR